MRIFLIVAGSVVALVVFVFIFRRIQHSNAGVTMVPQTVQRARPMVTAQDAARMANDKAAIKLIKASKIFGGSKT